MKLICLLLLFLKQCQQQTVISVADALKKRFINYCPSGEYFTGQRCQKCFNDQCICSTPFGCESVICQENQIMVKMEIYNEYVDETRILPQCFTCPYGCTTCTSQNGLSNAFQCQTCDDGFLIVKDICVPTQGQFIQVYSPGSWEKMQLSADQSTQVASCSSFNTEYQCIQCAQSSYLNEYGTCSSCQENCEQCTTASTCDYCSLGHWWNPNLGGKNGGCDQCNDNQQSQKCQQCSSNGYYCSECYDGYYLSQISNYEAICKYCFGNQGDVTSFQFGCKDCRIGGYCESCFDGYYLESEACTPCYGNAGIINKNEYTCKSCKSSKGFGCDECFPEYQLITNSICINCQQAQPNCLQCGSPNPPNPFKIICLVCQNGYYLIRQDETEGICSKCPPTMKYCYQNDLLNFQLIEPIPSQCPDDQYLVFQVLNTEKSVCISAKSDSICYIMQNDSQKCTSCFPFKKWLQFGDLCIECSNDNGAGDGCIECSISTNNVICTQCDVGYVLKASEGRCLSCFQGCLSCSENQQCQKCADGYRLVSFSCERCSIDDCKSCPDASNVCSECVSKYFLDNTSIQQYCRLCPPGCSNCQNDSGQSCDQCEANYYAYGQGCRNQIPFCAEYDLQGYCIVCNYGYNLNSGKCLTCLDQLGAYVCGVNAGLYESQSKSNGVLYSVPQCLIILFMIINYFR